MNFITSILEQGLIYGILALGIYITYKILDFPHLTVDGSFPLGAAITAALLTRGMNPYITLILSFFAGAVAGICTGLIHVTCKVRDLLSGIIMMTALSGQRAGDLHFSDGFWSVCYVWNNTYRGLPRWKRTLFLYIR